ncbi:MBOAT-domain-containing protein [Basidiobolus meristosporus CBS 931.73]|uniref:Lysophospholipid acyltransferase 5 n=1 Tax=Basidiobolus meristosporus CBS 931.73 TaxID=1314790 RepID=A0A1Y1YRU4_9FUNG|nr:MBOAT-domain-containing protein [Basidiobolus meristosporus CBS 931.73]|eukprot:ORY00285.1 MBOAT-domain-containing protein [Basidiobolus meristosporus CBS 931.73]
MESLSVALGVPLPTLKLLGTIVLAYPVAFLYRFLFLHPINSPKAESQRNLYIVLTGLGLSLFFSGRDIIHSFITISVTWGTCYVFNRQRGVAVILCFLFNLGYLLGGYYSNSLEVYDITWTMPQCILCLRMIGMAWDFYDGRQVHKERITSVTESNKSQAESEAKPAVQVTRPPSKAPVSFTNTALVTLPSFLEVLGYSYFFGAFLIGPQFSFTLYKRFINLEHLPKNGHFIPHGSYTRALRCLAVGAFYLAIQQLIGAHYPVSYMTTEEFGELSFLRRFIYMWISGKFVLNKYLGVWTLNEGSGALCGISFNEYTATGTPRWDGLANVDLFKYETATSLSNIIASFNMNTNNWSKLYIFKRMRFMGNKHISTFATLFFLAIWHGVHIGYFVCFATEFIDMMAEQAGSRIMAPYVNWMYTTDEKSAKVWAYRKAHQLFTWFLTTTALYYAIIPFELLQLKASLVAWKQLYFFGTIAVLGLIVFDMVRAQLTPKKRRAQKME